MTLHTLTVPDDPADLPRWLERRLMAPDFGRFVAELSALFPTTADIAPPCPLYDRWLPVALAEGLDPLPLEVLRRLLRHPAKLAAFQERIVTDGGAYWDEVLDRTDDLAGALRRGKRSLERVLSGDTPPSNNKAISKAGPKAIPNDAPRVVSFDARKRRGRRGYRNWAILSTGIAACLAVAVGFLAARGPGEPPIPKAQMAWGWAKPSGLAADQSDPKGYLNKLAANAEEWSLHRPSDPVGVGTRIAELRVGCTRLMHSTYGPLSPADKAWLLENCRTWAKILDGHQQALDAGADPVAVRTQVDETVRAIAAALREKAKQVG
ncbi:MAG TPA: hypothetical protein VKD90_14500 [Gemmataceae bacterium]|nr:hypothetical protein [Gemmataceae bacterium]